MDMQGQSGALPLLEFTLDQLFQRRSGYQLTLQAYHDMGGVKGALSKHAEETYQGLPSDAHRQAARDIFLRLIEPGTTEQDTTRRRAARSEFERTDPGQAQQMRETLEAFISARLLTTNQVGGQTTVEVSHEALIREWKRLADWLHEARDDIRFQRSLSEDVEEWEQRKHPRDRLYRGAQLKEARKWASHNMPSEKEAVFLRASAARRIQLLVGVIAVVLLLVSSLGVTGWYVFFQPSKTLVTTRQDNNGVGSLRWCIDNAPSGSTIRFAQNVRGIIELTGGDLVFAGGKTLTITGPGENLLTITGGNSNAIIHISKGATVDISGLSFKNSETDINAFLFNEGTLTVKKSIISDNKTTVFVSSYGGGIENRGTLTVKDSTISNNSVSGGILGEGGGIYNEGKLSVTHSTFSGNTVSGGIGYGYGGGIYNSSIGTLMVTGSILSSNSVSGKQGGLGGGIYNKGTLIAISSTLSANSANGKEGAGGGVANAGKLTVVTSTLSNNTATGSYGYGGGIVNNGELTVVTSTFFDNSASGKQSSFGGGILYLGIKGASAIVRFCTIYRNTANAGGGIWVDPTGSSQMTISGSVIAANRALSGPDISGALISDGYNRIENVAGATGLNATTDKQMTLTELGISPTLGNNGGPTQTFALLQGSSAIDAVPLQECRITFTDPFGQPVTITTDQRGDARPDGSENACDIGAYESSY